MQKHLQRMIIYGTLQKFRWQIYLCMFAYDKWVDPEWPKGTDCKSAGTAFEGSNPSPPILHSTDLLAVKQYLGCAKYMLCIKIQKSRRGGTGRRTGLKILRDLYSRTGSIPLPALCKSRPFLSKRVCF